MFFEGIRVDHSTYMSTLAKDMGASPTLGQLWREYGAKVLVCYWFVVFFSFFFFSRIL